MESMRKEPWIQQQEEKYRNHDFVVEDMKAGDLANLKGLIQREFIDRAETDLTKITIREFLGYLSSQGFRVTREKK